MRAVRVLCRWQIPGFGVPSFRPTAMAIALVVVGGTLLETGAIAHTPIQSSDPSAPIAALTGSQDALVAMAVPAMDLPLTASAAVASVPVRERTMSGVGGGGPHAGLVDAWALDGRATGVELTRAARLRALDPGSPTEHAVLSAPAVDTGTRAADARVTVDARAATTPRVTAAREHRKHPRWWTRAGPWRVSRLVTWYGPGFYGNRTACGVRYTRYVVGVAHRTLPCGTMVQFRWHGRLAVAPVIDRGPYGSPDLLFDWSAWLACRTYRPRNAPNGCFTRADVHYRVVGKVNLDRWFKRKK